MLAHMERQWDGITTYHLVLHPEHLTQTGFHLPLLVLSNSHYPARDRLRMVGRLGHLLTRW